jgi:hypothetical protein
MSATAGRQVEHKTTWLDQRQKAVDPDGRGHRGLRRSHTLPHWRQPIANNAKSRVQRTARR